MKKLNVCAIFAFFALLFLLVGCSDSVTEEEEMASAIAEAINEATSVEASISMVMEARIGSAGSVDGHTASISSDVTISSNFAPYAYHAELFSRILVDGATTREDLEYYVVPDGNDYIQYEYEEEKDEWAKTTLTRADVLSISSRIGVLTDWSSLITSADRMDEIAGKNDDAPSTYEFIGETDAIIIQEIFGNKIFGSFMHSTERLLTDEIPYTLYVDGETFLPKQLILSFKDSFIVSDMTFDTAEIIVNYSKWNSVNEISVPKKVSIVAADPDADFYSSFFAWNLFLPYIHGQSEKSGSAGNSGLIFISDWDTFQVRIDDGMTSLPLLYEDLNKLGYMIDSSCGSTILEPNTYVENIPVLKGTDKMICSFYNADTAPQPIVNCGIGSIDISASNITQNSIRIFLPGEVTLGITREALISAYGEPDERSSGFSADTYIWKGEKENQSFTAEISPISGNVIRLKLENIPIQTKSSVEVAIESSDAGTSSEGAVNEELSNPSVEADEEGS